MSESQKVNIIGAGLAGSEAAWQLAQRGVKVRLFEMKPERLSPAHQSPDFAELVCSNSFGSVRGPSGSGMLKAEISSLGSFILDCAHETSVPAGHSLAVDRTEFSRLVTERLQAHENIQIERLEVTHLAEDELTIVATGPLTGEALATEIQGLVGQTSLYFYDAISPILLGESIDMDIVFRASRYEDGPGDYLNCPLNEEQYTAFIAALVEAEVYPSHDFEDEKLFHGCQPIEAMAATGPMTLAFGPMKPVGLVDPRTGERPYAVVQLRQEDRHGQLWNIVGFQTKMRRGEQARVLRMLPGLEKAEFLRFGSIHRNTFLKAPELLTPELRFGKRENLYFAGQITGVEGYLESTASGLYCAMHVWAKLSGEHFELPPDSTMLGGLMRYLREAPSKGFQPMNTNFGLLPPLKGRRRGARREKRMKKVLRGLKIFADWRASLTKPSFMENWPELPEFEDTKLRPKTAPASTPQENDLATPNLS